MLYFKRNTSSSLLTKQNTLEVFVFTCKPAFLRSMHMWMDEGGRAEGEGDEKEKGKIAKLEIKASEEVGLPTAQEPFTEATPPVPPDPCPERSWVSPKWRTNPCFSGHSVWVGAFQVGQNPSWCLYLHWGSAGSQKRTGLDDSKKSHNHPPAQEADVCHNNTYITKVQIKGVWRTIRTSFRTYSTSETQILLQNLNHHSHDLTHRELQPPPTVTSSEGYFQPRPLLPHPPPTWHLRCSKARQSKMLGILSVNICLKNKKRKEEDLPNELSLEGWESNSWDNEGEGLQAVGPQEQGTEGCLEKQEERVGWCARHRKGRQDTRLGEAAARAQRHPTAVSATQTQLHRVKIFSGH